MAVLDADDDLHEICPVAFEDESAPLLPDKVLPELAFLVLRELGYPMLVAFLRSVASGELFIVRATERDLARTADIPEKYSDSRVDFVDCAIVAMAERLDLTRILTVDRRHFRLFRPSHTPAFEIVP